MEAEMLQATREAAWAAQSAAEAAWWALAVNGAVVLVAVGTTFFQEWRVSRRVEAGQKALHDGARETVRQGRKAVLGAENFFFSAGDIDKNAALARFNEVVRARRLVALFVAREVTPTLLGALLEMDDHLATAEGVLERACARADRGPIEYAFFNGELGDAADAMDRILSEI